MVFKCWKNISSGIVRKNELWRMQVVMPEDSSIDGNSIADTGLRKRAIWTNSWRHVKKVFWYAMLFSMCINILQQHRREDGGYPQVKLLFAERRECGKALALTRRIDREYAEAAKKRLAERRTFLMPNFRPGDPAAAYYAHLENIRRHLTIEDYSRVDAMIALRMRANGHSRESVETAIRACAPTIRETPVGRNWQRYAERTAAYAFGPAGDRDLIRNARYQALWRTVEGVEDGKPSPSFRMGS